MNLVESENWTLYDYKAVCVPDTLVAYMAEKDCDYILIDRADDYLQREFSPLFEGGLTNDMPAAASFQPRGAPCTFAAARQGVCAAAARQRYGMQYTGRPRPAGFSSAAGRRGGGVCLSLRSSLQGPAKSL